MADRTLTCATKPFAIQVLSDLHVEDSPVVIPKTGAQVIVLAGDIHWGLRSIDVAASLPGSAPVVFVSGNHDYWGESLYDLPARMKQRARGSRVHVLERDALVIDGVRFLGCTLWSDFRLRGAGKNERRAKAATEYLNLAIFRHDTKKRQINNTELQRIHQRSVRWLVQELRRPFTGPTVVVTHYAPSVQSLSPEKRRTVKSAAYASNLDWLVKSLRPDLWIHGHTHQRLAYTLGDTQVLSNPRGHDPGEVPDFDPGLISVVRKR